MFARHDSEQHVSDLTASGDDMLPRWCPAKRSGAWIGANNASFHGVCVPTRPPRWRLLSMSARIAKCLEALRRKGFCAIACYGVPPNVGSFRCV